MGTEIYLPFTLIPSQEKAKHPCFEAPFFLDLDWSLNWWRACLQRILNHAWRRLFIVVNGWMGWALQDVAGEARGA